MAYPLAALRVGPSRRVYRPDETIGPNAAAHRDLIVHTFRAKKLLSNGIVEGMNNKLKLVTRKSYGFRHEETLKIALYHTLDDLPTSPQTHRFVR